jgi:deoxyribodipyrimidine photo-lyase
MNEMDNREVVIFWFRRDLRLEDNCGLWHALKTGYRVIPLFIFDPKILERTDETDARLAFINDSLESINRKLDKTGFQILTIHDSPVNAFKALIKSFNIKGAYFNHDYEPYALARDIEVGKMLKASGIPLFSFKDQVIFEKSEVTRDDGKPYTIYTPYSVKWLKKFTPDMIEEIPSSSLLKNFCKIDSAIPLFSQLPRVKKSSIRVRPFEIGESRISRYHKTRDIPSLEGTSFLGPHLRFGTISIREVMRRTLGINQVFTKELIWREFFMQILYHFPYVEERSFRPEYDRIVWLNNEEHFEKWCNGQTGFPLVDAGMRELKETGYMHNRIRMVAANFLTRHLLTDWRWGEAWFAGSLLDFELSSNNGNWQWASGTGCDAAPYFRIFNPDLQAKKFDPQYKYIKRWIPEFGTPGYPSPIVDHSFARERAIKYYKAGIKP